MAEVADAMLAAMKVTWAHGGAVLPAAPEAQEVGSVPLLPLAPPAPSLWLALRRSARLRGRELRSIWIQSAGNGSGGGRQARVQHHRAHLQRAPQRRPHRVPHLQAPPVSTISLPSDGDLSSVPPSS